MEIERLLEDMPFADLVGVEVTELGDGRAEGRVELREALSWNPDRLVAHGGVAFTLADTVGGAALASVVDRPVPTVDMRIDYLEAGTGDLHATGEALRVGDHVGTADVTVRSDGERVATARGVYKTG